MVRLSSSSSIHAAHVSRLSAAASSPSTHYAARIIALLATVGLIINAAAMCDAYEIRDHLYPAAQIAYFRPYQQQQGFSSDSAAAADLSDDDEQNIGFGKRAPMDRSALVRFGKRAPMDRSALVRFGKRAPMDRSALVRFGKRAPMDRSALVRFGKRADDPLLGSYYSTFLRRK